MQKILKNVDRKIISDKSKTYSAFCLLIFFSISMKCMYFQYTTALNEGKFFERTNLIMTIATLASIGILMSSVLLLFKAKSVGALTGLLLGISVFLLGDTNFFSYYNSIITIHAFTQMNPKLLGSTEESITGLFKLSDIIYVIDIPILLAFLFLNKQKIKKSIQVKHRGKVAILLAGILIVSSIYIVTDKSIAISKNYVAKRLGVLFAHARDLSNTVEEVLKNENEVTADDIKAVSSFFDNKNLDNSEEPKYNGIAKDRNLIVIQVEALQEFTINRKIEGAEITPNLNKLIKDSLYFNNVFVQIADGSTSDAEFMANTSLYPVENGAAYIRFDENKYNSMPRILKDHGYNSYAIHPAKTKYWNREKMYKTLGFDKFIDDTYFAMDDFAGWEGTELSDESFFKQMFDKIDTNGKFFAFPITLSTHYPFTYFKDYDFNVGELDGEFLGNYIKAANYVDKCLGVFIDEMKKHDIYDNTLLVIYGDHTAIPNMHAEGLMQFLGEDFNTLEIYKHKKIPLIIHIPGEEKKETIYTTGGGIDIMPTVFNLMGIKAPFAMGKDLLNTDKGYAVLRNGSVVTDKYYYFNNKRTIFDINSGEMLNVKDYEDELKKYLHELEISDIIIEKDFFRNADINLP